MQGDSTSLSIVLIGDEYCHYFATSDGLPVEKDAYGTYCYLVVTDADTLALSAVVAHEPSMRSDEEEMFVSDNAPAVATFLSSMREEQLTAANSRRMQRSPRRVFGEPTHYTGNKKGLVILVNYTDVNMSYSDANARFNAMFNTEGYSENSAVGSVHDYFYDQSYGQFNLTFDVVGPVTVSKNMSYYGGNNTYGNDKRPNEMVAEACKLVDKKVNFSNYDWDGDGEVDQVFVIYAGYGESNGADGATIWPHESHLSNRSDEELVLDNVKIDTYACTCELRGSSGKTLNGMGTACHEFSHCLGLPDFYDTGYSGGFGLSYWDLMSSGSHSGPTGNGEVPTGYSAYERYFAGWLDFTELTSPCVVSGMKSIGDAPIAYTIYNDNNRNEYFILENRQDKKWYSYVGKYTGCHGLLITHVDYDQQAWKSNKVNTSASHQRFTIVPADKSYGVKYKSGGKTYIQVDEDQLKGDPFPGISECTVFSDNSHTYSGGKLFNANSDGTYALNKPLTDISEDQGLISFNFMDEVFMSVEEMPSDAATAVYYPINGQSALKGEPTKAGLYVVRDSKGSRVKFVKNFRKK